MVHILLRRIAFEFASLQTAAKTEKEHGHIEHIPRLSNKEEFQLRKLITESYSEHKRDRIRIFQRGNATVIKIERNNAQRRRRQEQKNRKELR